METLSSEMTPYKLILTVESGRDLPIGDITTSDPYVIAYVSGNKIGRTKTIYRNRINPEWKESFFVGLFHVHQQVLLEVYDEDHKNDDLLGTVTIDLKNVPISTEQNEYTYDLVNAGKFKSNGKMTVKILLTRKEGTIKVLPDRKVAMRRQRSMKDQDGHQSIQKVTSFNTDLEKFSPSLKESDKTEDDTTACYDTIALLTADNFWSEAHSLVKTTFFDISYDRLASSLNIHLLKDLLYDVLSVKAQPGTSIGKYFQPCYKRYKQRFVCSTKIVFPNANGGKVGISEATTFHRYSPLEENSIQINLNLDDTKFLLITFPNRFMMWTWCSWLQLAHEVWSGRVGLKSGQLPEWASSHILHAYHSDILLSSTGDHKHGRLALNLGHPHCLEMGKERFNILNISSIIVATDSVAPKAYTLEVEFIMDKILEKVSSSSNMLFKSAPKNYLLVASCRDETFRMNKNDSNTKCFIDFAVDELDVRTQSFMAGRTLQAPSGSNGVVPSKNGNTCNVPSPVLLPDATLSKLHFDLFLLRGTDGNEKVIGQGKCYVDALLKPENSTGSMLTKLDSKLGQPIMKELTLDKNISIAITIESALNILAPEASIKPFCSLYAKCKLVGPNGHSSSVKSSNGESKTSMVSISAPGRQGAVNFGTQFVFKADQLASNRHGYFRIEFLIGDGLAVFTSVGAAFVPIEYCALQKSKLYPFPVVRFRASPMVFQLAAKDGKGYGEVLVKLARVEDIVEESSSSASKPLRKINIRSTLHECTVYNTQWYAECVPMGGKDHQRVPIERALLNVLHDGLELSDITVDTEENCNGSVITATGSERESEIVCTNHAHHHQHQHDGHLKGTRPSFYETPSQQVQEGIIEIFESQRRNPYPPFEWSATALTRATFSNADFSLDYKFEFKHHSNLPDGLEWIDSDWKIDKTHIKTDENGWIYGFTFGKIVANYSQNISYTTSVNAHARRRKLIRRVKIIPSSLLALEGSVVTSADSFQRLFDHCNALNPLLGNSSGSTIISGGSDTTRGSLSSGSAVTASSSSRDWRHDLTDKYTDAILVACQERQLPTSSIVIPWKNIKNVSMITPSILCFTFSVNRYFPPQLNSGSSSSRSQAQFHPAEMEIFISNCHASALKDLIEERAVFARIREDFRLVQSTGKLLNIKPLALDEERTAKATLEHYMSNDQSVPETEELSFGSEVMAGLDDQSIQLQSVVSELLNKYDQSMSMDAYSKVLVYYQRLCRLRLYMASLIGLEIGDWHGFKPENISLMLNHDFAQCRKIVLENDVVTANNRIEYLLDVAEKRIRDAALSGWAFQGKGFEHYIQMFANDYFVEITGLLAAFFEEKGQTNVKGLTSKITLLNTFMKHNDRLQAIIESALRPYGLTTEPVAQLSVFLDIKVLAQWYKDVLQQEMRERLVQVLDAWKDPKRNGSELADLYNFPIPWIPLRMGVHSNTGVFYSNIPEDLVEYLMTYLIHARMNREDISSSFHDFLGQLDTKVFSSYANVFIFLAESYKQALQTGKNWTAIQDSDELAEYITWICSVANDAYRILDNELMVPQKLLASSSSDGGIKVSTLAADNLPEEVLVQIELSRQAFQQVQVMALDQLTCVLWMCNFHDKEMLLCNCNLLNAFKMFYQENSDNIVSSCKFMDSLIEDAKVCLQDRKEFLVMGNYQLCKEMMVGKVLILFLSLIAQSRLNGDMYDFSTTLSLTNSSTTATSSTVSSLSSPSTTAIFFTQLKEEGLVMKERLEEMLDEDRYAYQQSEAEMRRRLRFSVRNGHDVHDDFDEQTEFSMIPNAQTRLCLWLLEPILNLLTHAISDGDSLNEFIGTIKDLVMESRSLAEGVADCLQVCLSLKGVRKYESPKQKSHYQSNVTHAEGKTLLGSSFVGKAFRRFSTPNAPPAVPPTEAAPPPPEPRSKGLRGSFTELFSHIPVGPIRARIHKRNEGGNHEGTRDSVGHRDSDINMDDDQAEMMSLQEIKRKALEDCIDQLIQGLRHAGSPNPYGKSASGFISSSGSLRRSSSSWRVGDDTHNQRIDDLLISVNPFERLFSAPHTAYSLLGQIYHTALPSNRRDTLSDDDLQNGTNMVERPSDMGSNIDLQAKNIHDWFHRTGKQVQRSNTMKRFASVLEKGSTALLGEELSVQFLNQILQKDDEDDMDGNINHVHDPKVSIIIHDVKLSNLFSLNWFQTPKAYLVYRVDNVACRTAAKTCDEGFGDWTNDAPKILKIEKVDSSQMELEFDVIYEGMVADTLITSARIPFNPYDPPGAINKEIMFTEFSIHGSAAAKKAQEESRSMPKISVSVRIVSNLI